MPVYYTNTNPIAQWQWNNSTTTTATTWQYTQPYPPIAYSPPAKPKLAKPRTALQKLDDMIERYCVLAR